MFTIAFKSSNDKRTYVLRGEAIEISLRRPKATKKGAKKLDSLWVDNPNPRRFYIAGSYYTSIPSCCVVKNHDGKPLPKVYASLKLGRETIDWDWSVQFEIPPIPVFPTNNLNPLMVMQRASFGTNILPFISMRNVGS